jgi:hypothetical protein
MPLSLTAVRSSGLGITMDKNPRRDRPKKKQIAAHSSRSSADDRVRQVGDRAMRRLEQDLQAERVAKSQEAHGRRIEVRPEDLERMRAIIRAPKGRNPEYTQADLDLLDNMGY